MGTFAQEIEIFCERLAGVTIENQPALDVIARFDSKETLIYCDPPYVLGTRTMMKGKARKGHGYKHEMTDEDHQLLATALHSCKSMVVLSGYRSDLYKALFADWQQFECESAIEGGAKRTEVVWINPACSRALIEQSSQKSLFQEGEG